MNVAHIIYDYNGARRVAIHLIHKHGEPLRENEALVNIASLSKADSFRVLCNLSEGQAEHI